MSEEILERILQQQTANGETMRRIEALLSLSILSNGGFPKSTFIESLQDGSVSKLEYAKYHLLQISDKLLGKAEGEFIYDSYTAGAKNFYTWEVQGQLDLLYMTVDKRGNIQELLDKIERDQVKVSDVKRILGQILTMPKNATDLNRRITNAVKRGIKDGHLPDSGVFKKIKNSQPKAKGREFPSRMILTKKEIYQISHLLVLTWTFLKKVEERA